ncbi:MAG: superoxide dismutase family protein [Lachnospiraceae bacterium]
MEKIMSNHLYPSLQPTLFKVLNKTVPAAFAKINGNTENPKLHGTAYFYDTPFGGVLVEVEVFGLPDNNSSFYGMHIHETGNCTIPFDKTGNHYNPSNTPHPMHAGDMPPLLDCNGYAYSVFYTGRFKVNDIINRSIIIHDMADDFTTQPSGNSGTKIGCGVIARVK